MKLFRLVLIVALTAAGFAFFPAQDIASAGCVSLSGGDVWISWFGPWSMEAQTTIDITMTTDPSNGVWISIWVDGGYVVDQYTLGSTTVSYTLPADANEVWVYLSMDWYFDSNAFSIQAGCAGRDMVAMPDQAVVGTFVANTELLSSPSSAPEAGTGLVMEIGQSLWVYGVDSTGMYYQVLMSGNLLWVPVSSMGPNYDEVWNGTPLPTTVVG